MKAEYINPFIFEFQRIFESVTGISLTLTKTFKRDRLSPSQSVNIELEVVGEVNGNISMQCNQETAKRIVSSMMGGMTISELDEIAQSAIAELGNMITGRASCIIANSGKSVDITPPKVYLNAEMRYAYNDDRPTLAFLFTTGDQNIELNISINDAA
ncbi:chemotaxis protein CheX [Brevibacillus sp. NPDC058079]|uniref:chemotaxis protein CheX n=1 Tax=Brevibacillus sp. NPDC058079 TaxID=3346330 RepID=UPI0036DFB15C